MHKNQRTHFSHNQFDVKQMSKLLFFYLSLSEMVFGQTIHQVENELNYLLKVISKNLIASRTMFQSGLPLKNMLSISSQSSVSSSMILSGGEIGRSIKKSVKVEEASSYFSIAARSKLTFIYFSFISCERNEFCIQTSKVGTCLRYESRVFKDCY